MATARLLVCEKTGRWAAALRREVAGSALRVVESRSLAECRREVERSPASFVLVELTGANVVKIVEWIESVLREFPELRIAVLGHREAREHEAQVREAGAIYVAFSPRRLGPVVRMARRRLALAPQEELTFREKLWKRLPWKAAPKP
jgi:hypothetical protein